MPETGPEPFPGSSCPAGRPCCGFRPADPLVLPADFLPRWLDEAEDFAGAGLALAGLADAAGFAFAAGFVPVAPVAPAGLADAGLAAAGLEVPGLAEGGRFTASAADLGTDGLRTTLLPDTSPAAVAGLADAPGDDVVPAVAVAAVGG